MELSILSTEASDFFVFTYISKLSQGQNLKTTPIKCAAVAFAVSLLCTQSWAEGGDRQGRSIDIEQIKERLRSEFDKSDSNKDGSLSKEEFASVLASRNSRDGQRLVGRNQAEESRRVPRGGFQRDRVGNEGADRRAVLEKRPRPVQDLESETFETLDRDRDGSISEDEYAKRREALASRMSDREYARLDIDGNESIEFWEFSAARINSLREMDTNNDNVVSPEEMRNSVQMRRGRPGGRRD